IPYVFPWRVSGYIKFLEGYYVGASADYRTAIRNASRSDPATVTYVLVGMAELALAQKDYAQAFRLCEIILTNRSTWYPNRQIAQKIIMQASAHLPESDQVKLRESVSYQGILNELI
ncbi:MAG TPA: hypothetical protein PLZ51_07960, partial [Aggregatilineales bacterium]|nr:hypothetical protein [Aggregatilineales bacterium]